MSALVVGLLLAAKAVVAIVLVTSGVAKLVSAPDGGASRLPRLLAALDRRTGRRVLATVELAVGSTSLLALGSPVVDALALGLCLAFAIGSAILGVTARGTACQCFGAASRSTFGPRHTLATAALAAAAAAALVGAVSESGSDAWSPHPLMAITLVGAVALALRHRPLSDAAVRRVT